MPLPQFLLLLVSVIVAAGMSVWVAIKAGVPLAVLALLALTGVGLVHLSPHNTRL